MYPHERRQALMTLLSKHGFVSYHDLAAQLGVSEVTVRRDLRALSAEGLVETVVGGGQVKRSASEVSFMTKRVMESKEKERIAQCAHQLLEPGMTIGLTAGTTTWTLAQGLRGFSELTFVTNSTNVAIALKSNGYEDIHLTGGHFRTPSDALVGPMAESVANQFHTDLLFMGVHGVHLDYGISTPNVQEAAVNRALMKRSDRIVLLFDHSKWGIEALARIAELDEVDDAITDVETSETQALQKLGIAVHIAAP
ncbi:DeoR/GlpR family DNA-binding transcription regulator [Alicyclobacillus fastidiosus]|uniref:DeoR/GlpR family DNA-binding transcription regulator n=1 Tax=Alicyclobacillus fastidiosus TaxID=392011 RepID=A0ABY6ZDI9_9BACL|nr:DeoR/GlpR family DNA-binding transcription regulator [Alicyclobacillus fastidiosus]WAH40950.1 DeoR/GlpR family DNA-binding transcription regulator [Alicyclobacillus fastidiosus]GMA62459.1 DeoR family transcriptional regulator [Alicyclobacillus fastidiosus]